MALGFTAYYWKQYNKIIFKYVNSAMRPSFNLKLAHWHQFGISVIVNKHIEKTQLFGVLKCKCSYNLCSH